MGGPLTRALLSLGLLFGSWPVAGADPPRGGGVEGAADAALVAAGSSDASALEALARREEPDPWLVADELVSRGEPAAALALARAGGEALAPLVERLTRVQGSSPDGTLRRALREANELLAGGDAASAQRALELLDGLHPGDDVLADVRRGFGRAHALRALARAAESVIAFRECAQRAESAGWWLRARHALTQALLTARDAGDLAAAREAGARWLALETTRADVLGRGVAQLHLATVALRAKDWEALAGHEQQGLADLAQAGSPALVAGSLVQLGDELFAQGERARAGERYARAAEAWAGVPDRARAAGALHELSLALGRTDRDREAVDAARRAAALWDEAGDAREALLARVHEADVLLAVGRIPAARELAESLLPALEAAGDEAGQARAWVILGMASNVRLDGARAWEAGVRARALAARSGAARSAAMAELVLGSAAYALGRTAETIEHLERALPLLDAVGLGESGAGAANLLGLAYLRVGDPERASAWLERAAARVPPGSLLASLGLVTRAMARASGGDPAGAGELAERALRDEPYFRRGSQRAALLLLLAITHAQRDDWSGGLVPLREALATVAGQDPLVEAGARVMEVTFLLRAGDGVAAAALAPAALAGARELEAPLLVAGALGNLAEVRLTVDGRPQEALALCREALERVRLAPDAILDEHLATTRAADVGYSTLGVRAAMQLGQPATVLEFLEHDRALTLLAALGTRAAVRAWVLPAELLAAEQAARAQESRATVAFRKTRSGGDPSARAAAREQLEAARAGVEAVVERIEREAPRGAALAYPRLATLAQVQASLRADEALVLYGILHDEVVALRVEPDEARVVALGPAATLEAQVALGLEALAGRGQGAAPLEELRAALIEPLALPPGIRRLRVVPDGTLAFAPFPALLPSLDVAVLPSASVGLALEPERAVHGTGVLALGDPDLGAAQGAAPADPMRDSEPRRPGRLPAAGDEARAVGDVVLTGAQATEDGLAEALATRPRWRALHVACHGLLDPQRGSRSALVLAPSVRHDGLWRAADVLRTPVPADLVVLSACETGKGRVVKGEGILGLARAFLHAGAPRVICSLWKVDDDATRALMLRFYELYRPRGGEAGLPPAQALRQAQAHVRAQARWAQPRYWAAWVLWGLAD